MSRPIALLLLLLALPCTAQVTIGGGTILGGGFSTNGTGGGGGGGSAPVFNYAGGQYTSAISVTISCPVSGQTPAYTLDGSQPNIASTPYTSAISINSLTTLNALCFTPGYTSYNNQATSTDWKCNTLPGGTYGSLTCPASGGVSGTPSNVTMTWGSTALFSLSTTSSSGETQALFEHNQGSCPTCTYIAEDKYVEATEGKTYIANNEADVYLFDVTTNKTHMVGLQCEQGSGYWYIDSGAGTGWVKTNITADCPWPSGTMFHLALTAHWIIGDTGCTSGNDGGQGCLYYDDLYINGTSYDLTYLGPQPQLNDSNFNSSFIGNQDQIDLTNTSTSGQNPTTAGRYVQNNNVVAAIGAPTAVTSATYTF